ncbi:MAG: bifunctional proline dehydrogenase/L-glutamate gamma-semialdehyde dehydrogenase PutA [Gammaproteobacteria bacterium]|nr:bifunctional proline dehydrogenase/L-glutamate gamma-semialdehyde dehydrogenase PutA [Gammaproteobacteria bacterium]
MARTHRKQPPNESDELFAEINSLYLCDESKLIRELAQQAQQSALESTKVQQLAQKLAAEFRQQQGQAQGLKAFLQHYDLSSNEGIVLMCIAEALLRIPDASTMDALIADKLSSADWRKHLGETDSLFVNASTWALMLGANTLRPEKAAINNPTQYVKKLFARMEEPVVRAAMKRAMRIMAWQFVMGRNIDEAISRAQNSTNRIYRYSFDMLGEAALTGRDANAYQHAYAEAIESIGSSSCQKQAIEHKPGISIKLSALFPRYEISQSARAINELSQRLLKLAKMARDHNINLTVDAEESERLEMSLKIFARVFNDRQLGSWNGLGLAVQAYQKRALPVLRWLQQLAVDANKTLHVRLVKGAYWDSEIKLAQENGLTDYPVFTRKNNTDVSYLACARFLLEHCSAIYPQFATHNAHTIAYVYQHRGNRKFEYQRLHGMGEELYNNVIDKNNMNIPCRVYAPVGRHEDLLPYLVRRLLENGANTSFINQMSQKQQKLEELIKDPLDSIQNGEAFLKNQSIPLPSELFGKRRRNSNGLNFADAAELEPLFQEIETVAKQNWKAAPIINSEVRKGAVCAIENPATAEKIGELNEVSQKDISKALDLASAAYDSWNALPVKKRATILENTADLFEQKRNALISLCIYEAGKTIVDAHDEVREAIDFLRYYAAQARQKLAKPVSLPGPTGESNHLHYRGRGVMLCISPWNFPLAIFSGQIAAALVTGNTVLAKPAEQTSIVASYAVGLFLNAGLPAGVLQFLPGDGARIGTALLADERIAGVAFTGSTQTARHINQTLAARNGAIATLIAETGGQNAMLVDSSALAEQVVLDVVSSSFHSAGQRCSALRVLYLQEEIADEVLGLLSGHMDELVIGDPAELASDVGPLIDAESRQSLLSHLRKISLSEKVIKQCEIDAALKSGYYLPPTVIEIKHIDQLREEHFGPILHVIRFQSTNLYRILDDINNCGFGLTFGIHSRIEKRAAAIRDYLKVGNVYVNRSMTGAVVGVQPFGGRGLSGTGPKAGGPNYLQSFLSEQTYTVNTAAIGGNASLLAIG